MKFNIHGGHNPQGMIACGAVGILDESKEDRIIKDGLIATLRNGGHTVYDCTVDNGTSQNDVLKKIVEKCNANVVDWDISIHLNSGKNDYAGDGVTGGVEVWVYPNGGANEIASTICNEISSALGIRNRGVKTSRDLYVLRNTKSKAMLIEVCFVDDKDDADRYNSSAVVQAIARAFGITSTSNPTPTPTPQPQVQQGTIYRVRKTWLDAKSQIGAFGNLEYAKKACRVGYSVFDANGNAVYTNGGQSQPQPVPTPQPQPQKETSIPVYCVRTKQRGWLPEVKGNSDYAGVEGDAIVGIMVRNSDGTPVSYQAFCNNKWLPTVNGYNKKDGNNGWAGDGINPITAIYVDGKHYRVSTTRSTSYYSTVFERQDFAGDKRNPIDKVQIWN